jgi:hypothetical protein
MNEERAPSGDSPDHTVNPDHSQVEGIQESSSVGLKIAVVAFVIVAGIAAGYGWLQHNAARQLASERVQLSAALAQAKEQESALTANVNALTAAQAQQEAARAQEEAARAQAEAVKNDQFPPRTSEAPRHHARTLVAHRASVDGPRWKQLQNQLGDQQKELADSQKQIAETQANLMQAKTEMEGDLQSTRSDLDGEIALNHTQLVALEKKGERNYYEFSFKKSKTYHHTGPISIALRKSDAKHEYCDLQMLVDDKEIARKHVNIYESITLYPEGHTQPLELVINRIGADSVQGYVSEPKYRSKEQAAAPAPLPTTVSVNAHDSPTPDAKLVHRDEGTH